MAHSQHEKIEIMDSDEQDKAPDFSDPFPSVQHMRKVNQDSSYYFELILRKKWQICLVTFIGLVTSVIITFLLPKKYTSEVTLMSVSTSGGRLSSIGSQLSSLPGIGGQLGDLGKMGDGKNKQLLNILKSRTLTEKVIKKFDLLKILFKDQWDPKKDQFFEKFMKPIPVMEDGVKKFRDYSKIEEDKKSGLVKIQVTMTDPALAASIANYMVVELQDFIHNNSLTMEKRNRIFIEEQLVKTKAKLLEAGKDLNKFYASNKISSVLPELDIEVGSYEKVRDFSQDFLNELEDTQVKQAQVEVEKKSAKVSNVPGQVYLQFLTLNRELLAKAFALLTQQYEFAKIEEAKEDIAIEVIDMGRVPVRPSSPNLIMNLIVGLVGGVIFSLAAVFFIEFIKNKNLK